MAPGQSTQRRNWRKGLLAHLIIVPSWVVSPALLILGLGATVWPLSWPLRAFGLGVGAGLIMSSTAVHRAPLCALLIGLAWMAPSGRTLALVGASVVSVLVGLCCGGRFARWPAVWDFVSSNCRDFYDESELRGDLENLNKQKSCFAFHPHGCLAAGFTINGCYNPEFIRKAGKVNWLCDYNLRYKNPSFRWMCDAVRRDDHTIDAADKKTFCKFMEAGENISIIPGGFQDAVAFAYGKDRIVLKRRKGFVKYCLQYGYRLHPIYTFGECNTYYTFTGLTKLRMKISEQNIPMIAFLGWPLMPCMPRPDVRLMTYVGAAVDMPHIPEPTKEDVDKWHKVYMEALVKLFEDKKAEAGYPDAQLEVL